VGEDNGGEAWTNELRRRVSSGIRPWILPIWSNGKPLGLVGGGMIEKFRICLFTTRLIRKCLVCELYRLE
jgi:hypothetical protein